MSATMRGSVGADAGREGADHAARAADDELVEVPGRDVGRLLAGEPAVERVGLAAGDPVLGRHREGDAIHALADGGDVGGRAALLVEVVGWHADDGEPALAIARIDGLEIGELRGEAAGGGGVHHHQDAAGMVGEADGLAVEAFEREGIGRGRTGGGRDACAVAGRRVLARTGGGGCGGKEAATGRHGGAPALLTEHTPNPARSDAGPAKLIAGPAVPAARQGARPRYTHSGAEGPCP